MGDEIRHVCEFLYSIVANWFVLLGGAIMTALGLREGLRGKEVH